MTSAEDFDASGSMVKVPSNSEKLPRTFDTIMCLATKSKFEWTGSIDPTACKLVEP